MRAMLPSDEIERFRTQLLGWFGPHMRDLPWRRTSDPYAIWVSEIMLQQTRVATAISYYERFLTRFPDFQSLANASESDLLAHWAGLGYYYRARNLHKAARLIRDAGVFPATLEELQGLPGIGEYTAAAVASISFNLPHAALDGNVFRVLSRLLDDPTNIGSSGARKHFLAFADTLLDRNQPGAFNQAMMELGATVCLPKNPRCLICPVTDLCRARRRGRENDLPVKSNRRVSAHEQRLLFWIEREGRLLVWQRPSTSRLMPGFWELPERAQLPSITAGRKFGSFRHTITFHKYLFEVAEAETDTLEPSGECQWMPLQELDSQPTSTILRKASRVIERHGRSSAKAAKLPVRG
ncbi:MAG: A/G-specific adenine glycosylase [Bryobacteraceae bacterium]